MNRYQRVVLLLRLPLFQLGRRELRLGRRDLRVGDGSPELVTAGGSPVHPRLGGAQVGLGGSDLVRPGPFLQLGQLGLSQLQAGLGLLHLQHQLAGIQEREGLPGDNEVAHHDCHVGHLAR